MEKYGVHTGNADKNQKKSASPVTGRCPRCGARLEPRGKTGVPKCPNCGTKPFEKSPEA